MRIIKILVKPNETFFPSILFEAEIGHVKYGEAIIGVDGWLKTDDGIIVAQIHEAVSEEKKTNEVGARNSSFDRRFIEEKYKTTLISLLDKTALAHIEKRRMQDKKGDVNVTLDLNIKYAESQAQVFHSYTMDPKDVGLRPIQISTSTGQQKGEILASAYDPQFSTNKINQWIISGNTNPVFIAFSNMSLRTEGRIPANDWLHDFAPKLGLGEYFVIEIPKGIGKIEDAWKYINTAEECFRRWDTKGVFANCREVGYLFNRLIEKKFGKKSFSYKELWGRTYQRFENLASLDLHIEELKKSETYVEEDIKIGKEETEHILILTKILAKYAEELLQKIAR